jgi:hypothetical protein
MEMDMNAQALTADVADAASIPQLDEFAKVSAISMTKPGPGVIQIAIPTMGEFRNIRIFDIDPWDAKYYMRETADAELTESIRTNGIQKPLVATIAPAVGPSPETRYKLLDGYPTWICAMSLGMEELPVKVVEMPEDEARGICQYAHWSRLLNRVFSVRLEKWDYKTGHLRDVAEKIAFRDKGRWRGWIKAEYLDEVARGCRSKRHLEYAARNAYFDIDPLKTSMTWWSEVLYLVVNAKAWATPPEEPYAEMDEVYRSLAGAVRAKHLYIKDGVAQIELLKHYRRFTRAVCKLAQDVWPEVNFRSLLEQV